MSDHYRAAIVGLGFIGGADQVSGDALGQCVEDLDGTHVMGLHNCERVALVAGSSRNAGRRQRFHNRFGVPVFADWQQMLKDTAALDIVCIATYTPTHAEITHAALAAGARVVYCEKPVAPTLVEAEGMLRACDQAGALLVINHQIRFSPNMRRLRDLIGSGGLGTLTSASLQWTSGRLGNVGTHMFDGIQLLTGMPITAVSGILDLSGKPGCRGNDFHDPGGWGLLRLQRPTGSQAGPVGDLICVVDAAEYGVTPMRIRLHGTEGWAECRIREVVVHGADGGEQIWAPDDAGGESGMDRAVQEIVAWLDGDGGAFSYDAAEAVRTLAAIVGFHVSHDANGTWVELPLQGADRDRVLRSG